MPLPTKRRRAVTLLNRMTVCIQERDSKCLLRLSTYFYVLQVACFRTKISAVLIRRIYNMRANNVFFIKLHKTSQSRLKEN